MSVLENLPAGSARNKVEYLAKEIDKAIEGGGSVDISACIDFRVIAGERMADFMSLSNSNYNTVRSHNAALYHREHAPENRNEQSLDNEIPVPHYDTRRLEVKSAIDLLKGDEVSDGAALLMTFTVERGSIILEESISEEVKILGSNLFCQIGIKPKGDGLSPSFFNIPAAYLSGGDRLKFNGTASAVLDVDLEQARSIEDLELQFSFFVEELSSGEGLAIKGHNSKLESLSGFIEIKKGWTTKYVPLGEFD